jgi:hypothetical protein
MSANLSSNESDASRRHAAQPVASASVLGCVPLLVTRIDALLLFAGSEGCGLSIFSWSLFLDWFRFKGVQMNLR